MHVGKQSRADDSRVMDQGGHRVVAPDLQRGFLSRLRVAQVHLDMAQQYAESAVASTGVESFSDSEMQSAAPAERRAPNTSASNHALRACIGQLVLGRAITSSSRGR